MEAINREEITVSINGRETELLMRLIVLGASLSAFNPVEKGIALSIMDKLEPGIKRQADRQMQLKRDVASIREARKGIQ